ECSFMAKKGCTFNGGVCHQIAEQCQGCDRAKTFAAGTFCVTFPDPAIKWRRGPCNMASHVKAAAQTQTAKINPLKASKRASR
ncbi:MAG: PxxKW family cysteine-rich protein, partial [Proteobacteria bacterium]|nr:PxxKW family cysteine-rich protein [Pseudomonadota bacterium]